MLARYYGAAAFLRTYRISWSGSFSLPAIRCVVFTTHVLPKARAIQTAMRLLRDETQLIRPHSLSSCAWYNAKAWSNNSGVRRTTSTSSEERKCSMTCTACSRCFRAKALPISRRTTSVIRNGTVRPDVPLGSCRSRPGSTQLSSSRRLLLLAQSRRIVFYGNRAQGTITVQPTGADHQRRPDHGQRRSHRPCVQRTVHAGVRNRSLMASGGRSVCTCEPL